MIKAANAANIERTSTTDNDYNTNTDQYSIEQEDKSLAPFDTGRKKSSASLTNPSVRKVTMEKMDNQKIRKQSTQSQKSLSNFADFLMGGKTITSSKSEATLQRQKAYPVNTEFQTIVRAEKMINAIAKSQPPDIQVHNVLDIDFSHRKISQGERDMLVKAMKLEADGDIEQSALCLTRAGAHSKDPHVAKMMLANLKYRLNKVMAAGKLYTSVIEMLEKLKNTSLRLVHDEFLAYYNRSVINFRLGDDDQGLKDIEQAVELNPTDNNSKNLRALAKRRMGRYSQAIQEYINHRLEQQKKEETEKLKEQENRRKLSRNSLIPEKSAGSSKSSPGMSPPFQKPVLLRRGTTKAKLDRKGTMFLSGSVMTKEESETERLKETRGFMLSVPDPHTFSLKDKAEVSKALATNQGGESNDEVRKEHLKVFKINHGFKPELFQDLFIKPDQLQLALLEDPGFRTTAQTEVIATFLGLFSFLKPLSHSAMLDLASVIEYRTLSSKDVLFAQNRSSEAVCFLLKGHLQLRMELSSSSDISDYLVIGEMDDYSTFGHIDYLFRRKSTTVTKELADILYPNAQATDSSADAFDTLSAPEIPVGATHNAAAPTVANERLAKDNFFNKSVAELDRAVAPGMFLTYNMQSMCEMLMLGDRDFERILMTHALDEMRRRLEAVRSCKVFSQWNNHNHIRLARMGIVKSFREGERILEQGNKPSYLYIILKGLCTVHKRPNRTEMLYQKLAIAKEKAERHDTKYVFHHKLCHELRPAESENHKLNTTMNTTLTSAVNTATSSFASDTGSDNNTSMTKSKFKGNLAPNTTEHYHQTDSEFIRHQLAEEIAKLESLIQKAMIQDAKDMQEEEELRNHRQDTVLNNPKVCEIITLQWPNIFGEACVIDPDNGVSRGSITADTYCEVLLLHKTQIQTFKVDDNLIDRVKLKAVHYPGDPHIVVSLYRKQEWKHYKELMMADIPKNRWPTKFDTHEAFNV